MNSRRRASIDDLDALGFELSAEHLRLAAGGDLASGSDLAAVGGGGDVAALKKTLWSRDCTGFIDHHCWDTIYKP